ncbi:tRNA (adenosine(37)-N6)-dimethylallyltransferase MiaA [Treponema sp.]
MADTGNPLRVLLFFGPTASGKTETLDRLFAGIHAPYKAELVSADSMQVYRGMDIGTAKSDCDLRSRLPHHLVDIRNPNESFNVGDFVRLADEACLDIASRGRLPVVSGGTGFYLKHFVLGLPETPPSDSVVRLALKHRLEAEGIDSLVAELARVDPISAARIHANDEYRILRALEVFHVSGSPVSSFSSLPSSDSPSMQARPAYQFLLVGIQRRREELYRRINERTAFMFENGLPAELAALKEAGYGPQDPGLRAIGYQEFFKEDGNLIENLEAVQTLVARNSRRYAKRQILFFSSLPSVRWIDVEHEDTATKLALELDGFLKK